MPVEQMNVSLSPEMAKYVRKQVKSGSYTNISEVVRTAIRRLQEDEAREARTAESSADAIINELTSAELLGARHAVQAGLDSLKRGDYVKYEGRNRGNGSRCGSRFPARRWWARAWAT